MEVEVVAVGAHEPRVSADTVEVAHLE
jgi:hypothetical protein